MKVECCQSRWLKLIHLGILVSSHANLKVLLSLYLVNLYRKSQSCCPLSIIVSAFIDHVLKELTTFFTL